MFTRLGGGFTTPTPTPIDIEFRRLCESGIFGINVIKISKSKTVAEWRIQEFQNQGRGQGAVEFLWSGDCFDSSSHLSNIFVVRVVNEYIL